MMSFEQQTGRIEKLIWLIDRSNTGYIFILWILASVTLRETG